jgi:hypothetical protein
LLRNALVAFVRCKSRFEFDSVRHTGSGVGPAVDAMPTFRG